MDPDGNRLQNSCSPRHWGHSTMHRVPPVSGPTTTMYLDQDRNKQMYLQMAQSITLNKMDNNKGILKGQSTQTLYTYS